MEICLSYFGRWLGRRNELSEWVFENIKMGDGAYESCR